MDPGLLTPFLDFFRRGEVDRETRLQAARGALAPRAAEQLALLTLLVNDPEADIAAAAEATLAAIPRESLTAFLARSEVSTEIREFFAARGIVPADAPAADMEAPLIDTSPEPETGSQAEDLAPLPDLADVPEGEAEEQKKQSVTLKIAGMTVAQRMNLAMKGSREERSILIRDPNKLVSTSVLSSPKMTETEIESIARMQNVSEEILRIIGHTRAWVKNYNVALALVRNAKTPVALSMNLLNRLSDKDLRQLSTNRNIPELLRLTARKRVVIEK